MTLVRRVLPLRPDGCGTRLFLLVAELEKVDADLVAIDPGELAAPVREPGGRQQQKKFLQMQAFDRAVDGQLGAAVGDVLHGAVAPPGAVDTHHLGRDPALENNPAVAALVRLHRHLPCSSPVIIRQLRARLPASWLTAGKSGSKSAFSAWLAFRPWAYLWGGGTLARYQSRRGASAGCARERWR